MPWTALLAGVLWPGHHPPCPFIRGALMQPRNEPLVGPSVPTGSFQPGVPFTEAVLHHILSCLPGSVYGWQGGPMIS